MKPVSLAPNDKWWEADENQKVPNLCLMTSGGTGPEESALSVRVWFNLHLLKRINHHVVGITPRVLVLRSELSHSSHLSFPSQIMNSNNISFYVSFWVQIWCYFTSSVFCIFKITLFLKDTEGACLLEGDLHFTTVLWIVAVQFCRKSKSIFWNFERIQNCHICISISSRYAMSCFASCNKSF